MSLDGYVNDQQGNVGRLYSDFDALRKTEQLQASIRTTGAVVMGIPNHRLRLAIIE